MQKGFVLDDERLKQGKSVFDKDYFRELLERVRSIRTSERRIYQQITDIFAECSIDYDNKSQITKNFYAVVQNKFHYAITGQTAVEIIYNNADRTKENMSLTTWKNSPDGRILKSDTTVAKNYLKEKEIRQLERTVTGYFDYIEDLIEKENTFTQEEFAEKIGISPQGLSNIERNRYQPAARTIDKICKAFKITPFELLAAKDEDNQEIVKNISLLLSNCTKSKLKKIYKIMHTLVKM